MFLHQSRVKDCRNTVTLLLKLYEVHECGNTSEHFLLGKFKTAGPFQAPECKIPRNFNRFRDSAQVAILLAIIITQFKSYQVKSCPIIQVRYYSNCIITSCYFTLAPCPLTSKEKYYTPSCAPGKFQLHNDVLIVKKLGAATQQLMNTF